MRRQTPIEAPNEYLGKQEPVTIGEIGQQSIEVIDKPLSLEGIELEKFMHEPVTVVVLSSGDEDEVDMVPVGVNGVTQYFRRNVAQVVKRKFVERLARAKKTNYSQNIDDRLGEAMNRLTRHPSLQYPFTVIQDSNPKGPAWLRGILAEAN